MSEIDNILSQIPMDQVAQQLGVDRGQAEQATRTALPALLGGLAANAQDPAGEASLGQALSQHDPGLLGSDLSAVDTNDGQKIVQNIFGGQTDGVVSQLGRVQGAGSSQLISKLLPILAPIVMAYLARKLQGGGGQGLPGGAGQSMGGGGLGDVLGQGAGGGGLGDILGQVLGGAQQGGQQGGQAGAGNVLGDVLGGLLGGGKR